MSIPLAPNHTGDIRTPGARSTVNDREIPPAALFDDVQSVRGWNADRRNAPRRSSAEVLQGLPAQILLDRLDTATVVTGFDGVLIYANLACERMLGYQTARTLEGQLLTALLTGQSDTSPRTCIELLRDPKIVTNWNHSDGYPVATLASDQLLLYSTDLMLMVSLTDISDREWEAVDGANRFSM